MSVYKLSTIGRVVCRNTTILQPISVRFGRFYATKGAPGAVANTKSNTLKMLLISMGVGGAIGTTYTGVTSFFRGKDVNLTEQQLPDVIDHLPDVKITRKFVNPKDKSNLDLVLFQFQTCPFCCKVRAYLDSQGFSYSVVEVDAVLRQSIKWSKYKKVPTLLARRSDGKYIQLTDSSTIISTLATFLANPSHDIGELANFYPNVLYTDENGKRQNEVLNKYFLMNPEGTSVTKEVIEKMDEERHWRQWADTHLVHLISPNVYRSASEAFETFEWFSYVGEWDVHFPRWERNMMVYVGATAMWAIAKRLKKRHNLDDDVRSHLYDACNKWTTEIDKEKRIFLGGKTPNLADLSVFGVLNSMEGCQAFIDCLENTNIGPWFYAMKEFVLRNKGTINNPVDVNRSLTQFA